MQRLDESVNRLHGSLDIQRKTLLEALKDEEISRTNSFTGLRVEINEMAENTVEALTTSQRNQAATIQKITETVKTEVQCRSKAEN